MQELSSINPICNVFSGDALVAKKAEFFSSFSTKRDNLAKQLCASPGMHRSCFCNSILLSPAQHCALSRPLFSFALRARV